MNLSIKTVIALVIAALVLVSVIGFFMLGFQTSPLDAQRTFAEGCAIYCPEISDRAVAENIPIGIAAVRLAHAIAGSSFIQACNFLYPETTGYPYLCWLNNCCTFELPPP